MVADVAHGLGEVGGGDEEHVDVVHGENFGEVVDGLDFLDQHDDEGLIVGVPEIIRHPEGLPAAEHAAIADGSVFGRLHGLLGGLAGVDVRHHDAHGAAVEGAHDGTGVVVVHARHRRHAPQVAGARHVTNRVPIHRAVLALKPHAVEAELSEKIDHVRIVMAGDGNRRLARLQLALDAVFAHELSPLFH